MHSFPTLFRKKNARQYFQILVDLEKIPKALTAEIVLIKSLNIWKNKNKQTKIEYDFLFNRINRFYMRKFFFLITDYLLT